MSDTLKSEYIVSMLDKSLKILDYLFHKPGFTGIAEISSSLNIAKGTVFRILYTLQQYNFVRKNELDQYALGVAFITYGTQLKNQWDLLTFAQPIMEEVAKNLGESVNIGILLDDHVITLDTIPGEEFYIVKNLIPLSPLYCSSMGKIFLSEMTDSEFSEYTQRFPLQARTVSTITDPKVLAKEIQEVKKSKVSYDREEYTYGLTCVGAGIYHGEKLLATVSISGPTSRLEHKGMENFQEAIKDLAKSIEDIPDLHNLLVF